MTCSQAGCTSHHNYRSMHWLYERNKCRLKGEGSLYVDVTLEMPLHDYIYPLQQAHLDSWECYCHELSLLYNSLWKEAVITGVMSVLMVKASGLETCLTSIQAYTFYIYKAMFTQETEFKESYIFFNLVYFNIEKSKAEKITARTNWWFLKFKLLMLKKFSVGNHIKILMAQKYSHTELLFSFKMLVLNI